MRSGTRWKRRTDAERRNRLWARSWTKRYRRAVRRLLAGEWCDEDLDVCIVEPILADPVRGDQWDLLELP